MKLAAVIYEPGDAKAVDALFVKLAVALKADGWRVAGAIQHNDIGNACANMVLEDITSGRSFNISVPGEKKLQTCSLDPAALEDVAGQVGATLDQAPHLVIVNRFGKQEVLGHGFRSVIESAIAAELPVLTALCTTHLENWNGFTGNTDERLTGTLPALLEWCRSVVTEHA